MLAPLFSCAAGGPAGTPARPSTLTIPGRVFERMLLVPVRVEGHGPFWFVIDTASLNSAIDRKAAESAGLMGARGKARPNSVRLDISGASLTTSLKVIDLSGFSRTEDQPLGGVLGMDLFRKFVVRLDYDAGVVTLEDPSTAPADSAQSIPLVLKNSLPYVVATMQLEGQPVIQQPFLLDTSTGDDINDGAFAQSGALQIGPDLGRAVYFQIGPYRMEGVNGTSGPGKLGGELLHRFHVTMDVRDRRLILVPNRHYADAFLFDTSGADIERSAAGLKITRVFDRTPAKEAGLDSGDEILTIDGQSAKNFSVDQVRLMFHEVGEHQLLVRSHGTQRMIQLRLRTLL